MKKALSCFICAILLFLVHTGASEAAYDPMSRPNNKIGIHILFPGELSLASELVNSNGGEWGYVTIPIQAGDKDIVKWQHFMDEAKGRKLIPIIRIATEGDYFINAAWRKPTQEDILDFANFLDSLNWPTKNRYVVIFNEVNRADEWQGASNPEEYAKILEFSVTLFKSKNSDFFIISSGLDNASETSGGTFNQHDFLRLMDQSVPGIFNQIDGLSSHSYPNPGFSSPPEADHLRSVRSFEHELETIRPLSNKNLPVFITETNWSQKSVQENTIARYFETAMGGAWKKDSIIAITPFILKAGSEPFSQFTFVKENGDKNEIFKTFEKMPKTKGSPILSSKKKVLGESIEGNEIPLRTFKTATDVDPREKAIKSAIKWVVGI